jgi:hypothetical protein
MKKSLPQVASAEDPERAQEEITRKRETANIKDPSVAMIKRLASHRIYYRGKVYTNDGSRNWTFSIKDPDPSSTRAISFPEVQRPLPGPPASATC